MNKFITVLLILLSLNKLNSQCSANFVYTINPAGNVTFSNTSTFTGTNVGYTWYFGDFQSSNLTNPSNAYSNNGIYTVYLILYDSILNNSCSSTFTQNITITNTACVVSANIYTTQSANGVVFFYDNSTGTTPNTTYSINFGDNTSSNSLGAHTYSASGNYSISYTVSNIPTCTSIYTTVINVLVQSCTLTANFVYSISAGTATFTDTSVGTTSTTSYYWDFGNSNTSNLQSPPPQTYNYNGTYTVSLTIQDSVMFYCSSTITQTIAITNASCYVNSSFTLAKDSTQMPLIVWDAFPTYPTNVVSTIWNWGDNTSSNAMYPSHTYSAVGVYTICLTVSVSCGGTTTTCMSSNIYRSSQSMAMAVVNVINQATGIKNNEKNIINDLIIQPNPSNGSFSINNMNKAFEKLIIYNQLGQQSYTRIISDQIQVNLDLDLPNGIYFVQLNSDSFNQTKKIIINK